MTDKQVKTTNTGLKDCYYICFDTNILLVFYELSDGVLDDIFHSAKLQTLKPITTTLLKDEFYRNRKKVLETKLAEYRPIPVSKNDVELSEISKDCNKEIAKVKSKFEEKITNHSFKADKIIKHIFEKAVNLEFNDEIIAYSRLRYDLGYAPGKGSQYNDMVNWQTIIFNLVNKIEYNKTGKQISEKSFDRRNHLFHLKHLYFCTEDNDYKYYKDLLQGEFKEKTQVDCEIISLKEFADLLPDIKERTSQELEKLSDSIGIIIIENNNRLRDILMNIRIPTIPDATSSLRSAIFGMDDILQKAVDSNTRATKMALDLLNNQDLGLKLTAKLLLKDVQKPNSDNIL